MYTRFFTYKRELTEPDLHELTEGDPKRVVALVVTTRISGGEKLIGGGRYCSDVTLKSAELAFMTDDAYRGRGIASLVLQHLVRIGRANGVAEIFEADVLAQNQAMPRCLSQKRTTDEEASGRRHHSPKSFAGYRSTIISHVEKLS